MSAASADLGWLLWGVGIMLALPVLVIALGEVAEGLERSGRGHLRKPVDAVRSSCLFLLFAMILLRYVAGLPEQHLAVKIVDTAFWITVLNAALITFDAFIFQPGANDWRATAPRLLIDIVRLMLVAAGGAFVVSSVWQVNLGSLLAALGVGSLVIGLALQETLGNVFSGIAMISARQFAVGDWIRIGDIEGQVRAITWRSVSVTTLTGDVVVIPNIQFGRDRVRLLGADQGWVRITADFRFAYDHPPQRILDMLNETAATTADVLPQPPPAARLISFDDGGVLYRVAVTVADPRKTGLVRSDLNANVWYVSERRGLAFPARYNRLVHLPDGVERRAGMTPDAIARELERVGTFRRPEGDLVRLTTNARATLYRRGEALVRKGEACSYAFVVLEGSVEAVSSPDDGNGRIDNYGRGALVLFKEFFRGTGAPHYLRAATDIQVVEIPIADLERALAEDRPLAQQVEQLLTARAEARQRGMAELNDNADAFDRLTILREMFGR